MNSTAILFLSALVSLNSVSSLADSDVPAESVVTAPERETMLPYTPGDSLMISPSRGTYTLSVNEKTRIPVGFSFENDGPNRIIPRRGEYGSGPDREFNFYFQSRARQNIYMSITDAPTEYLSHRMESYLYFFPRINLPAIQWDESQPGSPRLTVTLPTGETMDFDGNTHETIGGVLEELAPIDLNPDRFSRKFVQIKYHGSGIMIRVDRRGGDPRLGTIATVTKDGKTCKIPSSRLFNQDPHSEVEFLFPSDAVFNSFLIQTCKMSFL